MALLHGTFLSWTSIWTSIVSGMTTSSLHRAPSSRITSWIDARLNETSMLGPSGKSSLSTVVDVVSVVHSTQFSSVVLPAGNASCS